MSFDGRSKGGILPFFTEREDETMKTLLEDEIKTYADAARRLGITENAVALRMSRAMLRYERAKALCNEWERFRRNWKNHKKGKR
jgi:hypothetical protein